MINQHTQIEFGDFQTPLTLASEVVTRIAPVLCRVKTVIEPTCGCGNFLAALYQHGLPASVENIIGWEISGTSLQHARQQLDKYAAPKPKPTLAEQDIFCIDWSRLRHELQFPILFVGNPPWVTSSRIGRISGDNLPTRSNVHRHAGLDAMTGKGNFDISEWILLRIAELIAGTDSVMALLVKSSVARKVIATIREQRLPLGQFSLRRIDASAHFDVSVDACLFYAEGKQASADDAILECPVFSSLAANRPNTTIGFLPKRVVSQVSLYKKWRVIDSQSPMVWRSGVKHDCARVMELRQTATGYRNGLGEEVELPETFLYPFLKSTDIARGRLQTDRYLLLTQRRLGEATESISLHSPATWRYLQQHDALLANRKSVIYRHAPPYAVFGIGDYAFEPWKVAISGLAKETVFTLVPPRHGRPVMFDDACYFLSFSTQEKAEFLATLLASPPAKEFLASVTFREDKRPITAQWLNRMNLQVIAHLLGEDRRYDTLFGNAMSAKKPRTPKRGERSLLLVPR